MISSGLRTDRRHSDDDRARRSREVTVSSPEAKMIPVVIVSGGATKVGFTRGMAPYRPGQQTILVRPHIEGGDKPTRFNELIFASAEDRHRAGFGHTSYSSSTKIDAGTVAAMHKTDRR